ncbi:hypothetical protein [Devosia sp. CAU 1758]
MRAINMRLGATGLALLLVTGIAAPAWAQDSSTGIDFGDDTSEWANDGECDDMRFAGTGMAEELEDADVARDATDCQSLFEAGSITLAEPDEGDDQATAPVTARPADIDFGDDTSSWANDGECDDPRFAGASMAIELEDVDIARDATDCRTAYEAGSITLIGDNDPTTTADIDFGDDTSEWAKDQECDDPRFAGSAMASELDNVNIMRDASDCRQAYEDGTITLARDAPDEPPMTPVSGSVIEALAARINFGDDSGTWPNDNECDDPDFFGPGVVPESAESERQKDASDCRAAFLAGTASLKSGVAEPSINFGDDTSEWANDGECDDLRFAGETMGKRLDQIDIARDATDCRWAYDAGMIMLR